MINPKELDQEILDALKAYRARAKELIGRRILITAFYNGQCYGASKKNLQGTELVIRDVAVSDFGLAILPVGHRVYLSINQFELLP